MTRKLWTEEEDKLLKLHFASHKEEEGAWEEVSSSLKLAGHRKSAKQCRDRWINHLDPSLLRVDWQADDNAKLLDLHESLGSHWKIIAQSFPGRTDNSVKNQFFSLVRKSLRKARKSVSKNANTAEVNAIKPKILSNLFLQKLDLPKDVVPSAGVLPVELQFLSRPPIPLKSFVLSLAFSNIFDEVIPTNPKVATVVDFILHSLEQQNRDYVNVKVSKKPRKVKGGKIRKIRKSVSTPVIEVHSRRTDRAKPKPKPLPVKEATSGHKKQPALTVVAEEEEWSQNQKAQDVSESMVFPQRESFNLFSEAIPQEEEHCLLSLPGLADNQASWFHKEDTRNTSFHNFNSDEVEPDFEIEHAQMDFDSLS